MTDPGQIPEVEVKKQRRLPVIWIIPLVAAAIGAWLVVTTIMEKGPEIAIRFETAQGLEAGKTKLKHKDVEIGIVDTVTLDAKLAHVVVTAKMQKGVDGFLRTNTRFWVVRPRLALSGVSGLSTLVSGAYIEMDPGDGDRAESYVGLEVPPVIRSDVPGKEFMLEADRLGSLGPGVAIYFRGIEVGEIMGFELRPDARGVRLPIFIKAPYDALVRKETVFWNSSGIDIVLNADGIRIRTESAQALLAGGITFETPTSATAVDLAKAGQVFRLFRDREMQEDESLAEIIPVLARFDGSVRGLKVGAPIEFRGIRIGTVAAITFESDPKTLSLSIAVLLNIEPERIRPPNEQASADPYDQLEKLVAKGMRAQLQSGNLLTGQLLVNWDFFPDSAPAVVKRDAMIPEIPTVPSDFEQISGSVNTVLAKLSALPMKELIEDVRNTVRAAGKLAEAPELQSSLASLDRSLSAVERVVNDVDGEIGPLLNSLKQTSDKAEMAAEQAAKALASTDEFINRDSEGREMLLDALRELASAAQSINSLATYLERHPEALIQGKAGGATR